MKRRTTRSLAVIGLVVPATLAAGTPAMAADEPLPLDFSHSRTSVQTANVNWTEIDAGPDDPVPGNVHIGFLSVYKSSGSTDVFGGIEDFQCEAGESPGFHGGPGVPAEPAPAPAEPVVGETPPGELPPEEPDGVCDALGTRFLSSTRSTAFTLESRRGRARLTGLLQVSNGGHGEPGTVLGQAPADIRWRMTGSRYRFTREETWEDDVRSTRTEVKGNGFRSRMSGTLGPMNFTDDADDVSDGNVERWTEIHRMEELPARSL